MKVLNLFLALAFLMVSCSANNSSATSNTDNKTEEHTANTETPTTKSEVLAPAEFEKKLAAMKGAHLVDVRTADEFGAGTISNANNIDYWGDTFKEEIAKLDKEKPLFLFCKSGGRSGKATQDCLTLGFKEVYDLEGGYMAWQNYKQ